MTFREKMDAIRINPGLWYDENVDEVSLSTGDPIEDLLCHLYSGISKYDGNRFEMLSNLILEHSDFRENPEYQYQYHISRSTFFRFIGEIPFALESAQKAYKLSLIMSEHQYIMKSLTQLSTLYSIIKDFETASFYIEQALEHIENVLDILYCADTYNALGLLMFDTDRYDNSLKAYLKAIDYYDKIPSKESHLNYVILLLNTGEVLMELGEETEAETFFSSGIRIAEEKNFLEYFGQFFLLISEVFYRRKQYHKAYEYLKRYISQNDRFLEEQNRVHQAHDKDKLKEEIHTLNILKMRNEELSNRLNSLYDRLDSRGVLDKREGEFFEQVDAALAGGEIRSWFQPQWSVSENRFTGAEALARWIKPDGSVIKPGDFISLIEESSLIHKLTTTIVREAFSFCRKVRDAMDLHFIVSINISPYELHNFDVVTLVEKEMLLKGLYPENVEIEITERTFLDRNPRSMNQLFQLKELGVRIALDDFGTGYSSLACLNRIPFDRVKIDRSLLLNASTVGKGDRMLGSIIKLLHDLEFPVVVEGLEKKEHLDLTKQLNSDLVQGFYFSKALPPDDLLEFLRKNH